MNNVEEVSDFLSVEKHNYVGGDSRAWVLKEIIPPYRFNKEVERVIGKVNARTIIMALKGENVSTVLAINIRRLALSLSGRYVQ